MQASALVQSAGPKYALYQEICEQLHHLLGAEKNFVANAANTSALLFRMLPDINWVGFYLAEGNDLVLGPFQGKPATARIRVRQRCLRYSGDPRAHGERTGCAQVPRTHCLRLGFAVRDCRSAAQLGKIAWRSGPG